MVLLQVVSSVEKEEGSFEAEDPRCLCATSMADSSILTIVVGLVSALLLFLRCCCYLCFLLPRPTAALTDVSFWALRKRESQGS